MKKLLLVLSLLVASSVGAWAQNTQCSNRPSGDNSNACANTRFVQTAVGSIPSTTPGGTNGQIQYNNAGAFGGFTASGDFTINTSTGVGLLATVNANVGSFGGANSIPTFTVNAKGLVTAAGSATPQIPVSTGVTGLGNFVAAALAVNAGNAGSFVTNITATQATALSTAAIASTACNTTSATATGATSTDVIVANFNSDPTAVTGYAPLTTGGLTIYVYPTTNNVNFRVCNPTGSSITPGPITLNWKVIR